MKILLPFNDDSTLFFVSRVKRQLSARGHKCGTLFLTSAGSDELVSKRQLDLFLPGGTDFVASTLGAEMLEIFDAFITCKPTRVVRNFLSDDGYRIRRNRPCFVAFQPGLEFSPEKGIGNRRKFDAIFVNRQADIALSEAMLPLAPKRVMSWGHPYFSPPQHYREDTGGPAYFFAQAISPRSIAARMHVLEVLRALALANPQREFVIKLRHLPGENAGHVHKEDHSYPDLMQGLETCPDNLRVSACSLEEALEKAAVALTCTSTAAMDAISAGLPAIAYTDYVENYLDPMSKAMKGLFAGSGVLASLEQFLNLEARRPEASWLNANFRDPDVIWSELETTVEAFKKGAP